MKARWALLICVGFVFTLAALPMLGRYDYELVRIERVKVVSVGPVKRDCGSSSSRTCRIGRLVRMVAPDGMELAANPAEHCLATRVRPLRVGGIEDVPLYRYRLFGVEWREYDTLGAGRREICAGTRDVTRISIAASLYNARREIELARCRDDRPGAIAAGIPCGHFLLGRRVAYETYYHDSVLPTLKLPDHLPFPAGTVAWGFSDAPWSRVKAIRSQLVVSDVTGSPEGKAIRLRRVDQRDYAGGQPTTIYLGAGERATILMPEGVYSVHAMAGKVWRGSLVHFGRAAATADLGRIVVRPGTTADLVIGSPEREPRMLSADKF